MEETHRKIFSNNLKYYMKLNGKKRNDLVRDLGFPYTSIRDWEKGICYAKMDKIEKLADYFNIPKHKLIENNDNDKILNTIDKSEENKLIEKILLELPSLSKEKLEHILDFIIFSKNK